MIDLQEEIGSYWSGRADGYSEVNEKELVGVQHQAWLRTLTERFPDIEKDELKILDIGTGPGFFPMILSMEGYRVTAIDYTPEMLAKAKENMRTFAPDGVSRVDFIQMDGQSLDFPDESYDVVISRNLTWNLPKPDQAYSEWYRVLKPSGSLLVFDANWYGYLYDEEKRQAYEQDRANVGEKQMDDHYIGTDIDRMEKIALQIPMSNTLRPSWDKEELSKYSFEQLIIEENIWETVWSEEEKLNYASTPMFMIYGVKK